MDLQLAFLLEALLALVTPVQLLPRVSAHVDLQLGVLTEALHALVTSVRLLTGVSTHVDGHLGIVGSTLAAAPMPGQLIAVDDPLSMLLALGHAVLRRQ